MHTQHTVGASEVKVNTAAETAASVYHHGSEILAGETLKDNTLATVDY